MATNTRKNTKSTPTVSDAKDWTYLLEKDPSNLHETFAAWISAELGVEFDPKHVQVVLAMHPTFQKSERNKSRADYKPLDTTIVHQRSVHMVAAHQDAKAEREQREAAAQAKKDAAAAKRKATLAARKASK